MLKKFISRLLVPLFTLSILFSESAMPQTVHASALGSHQPYLVGYHSTQVSSWTSASDPNSKYLRSRVPLATRIAAFSATQAKPSLSAAPQMHSLMGDYTAEDIKPTKYSDIYAQYLYNFWQYTDSYSAWHGLPVSGSTTDYGIVNLPNPGYTDAAHRNGVISLGCWFTPRTGHTCSEWLTKSGSTFPLADKLVEMANYYGFDGYFINQEQALSSTDAATFKDFLTYMRSKGMYIQIYDALTNTGSLSYQNAYNSNNSTWLKNGTKRVADSMFLNYWWSGSGLTNSASYATSQGLNPLTDVLCSLEAGGNQYSPAYDPANNVNANGSLKLGMCQLGNEFVWTKASGNTDPAQQENVYTRERIWWSGPNQDPTNTGRNSAYPNWDGIANFIAERSVIGSYPFTTRFNTGHGTQFFVNGSVRSTKEWCNAGVQDILPTWQWWMTSSGTKLSAAFDYTDAYDGGSSLKISGNLSTPNDLRLYKTKLPVSSSTQLSITYKTGTAGAASNMKVGLIFEDAPTTFTYLDVGNTTTAGWNTNTFSLSSYAGRTVAAIGLRFEGTNSSYAIKIGELSLRNAAVATPSAPAGFAIEQSYVSGSSAEVFLKWNFDTSGVWYYNIKRVKPDGTKEFLGRIYDEVYYVKSLDRVGSETSTTLELTKVGFDGGESSAATTVYTWSGTVTVPSTPTGLAATASGTSQVNVSWNASTGATGYDLIVDGTTVSDVTSPYSHTGLTASTTHTYQVRAKNSVGTSAWSSSVSAATSASGTTTNVALNKTATADSYVTGETPAKAVDGATANNSKWCSTSNVGAQWLKVDLGSSCSISRWVVKHAGAGGESSVYNTKDFKLQKSTDGTTWTDVDSVTGNTANTTDRSVTSFSARYVRLYITNPQTSANYIAARIYEFEVYGN